MLKRHFFLFCNQEQSQLQSELLNIESQCTMLSEGIKERQRRIEEFEGKIHKVMNDILLLNGMWNIALDQIPNLGLLQYVLKQSLINAKFYWFAKLISLCFFENHYC